MYFSERRKQGLGSLRPGYFIGGPIGSLLLGNAVNWGLGKGMDYAFKSKEQREKEKLERDMRKLGIYGYFPEDYSRDDDDETNKTSGWKGGFKGGLMNLLATAMLGPVMGPLALTVGRGIMNKSKGLSFTGGGEGSGGRGPKGPTGKNIDYYTGSDEEDKDNEWSPTTPTSAPSHIGPTGQDIHGNGGGNDGWSGGAETRDSSGWESSPFFKGGRVSYSKGGIASLWQR